MRFESNGPGNDLKLVNDQDRVLASGAVLRAGIVGYAWKSPNGYWQATTGEDTGRRIVRTGAYRQGKGYVGSDEARAAIIEFVTGGEVTP